MKSNRLEAFSDGVLAIVITIMVLEIKVPHGSDFDALKPLFPIFFSYLLSFIYIGIYWNNHHHLLHSVEHVNGKVLWANMHLLFWLSLIPFTTGWLGENYLSMWPVALYGFVLLMAAVAYYLLAQSLINLHGRASTLASAVGKDWKGKISLIIYAMAIGLSFVKPWISLILYGLVALMWFIPDTRIEKKLIEQEKDEHNHTE